MRLIDANKLEEEMQDKCVGDCGCCTGDCPAYIQPTAIDLVEHDKQIRADERNRVFSTLSKLIESDYNSKECKLLLSDLCETILEQLKGE